MRGKGWLILWLVSIAAFIVAGVFGFLTFWRTILGIGGIGVVAFLMIWYWLAPSNRWFTFVKEGTAKIVVKGDAFSKALIQWEGYTFDDEWNVVPENVWMKDGEVLDVIDVIDGETGMLKVKKKEGEGYEVVYGAKHTKKERHLFGGLRYYGFYPIWDILIYMLRWNDIHRSEEKEGEIEKVIFHEEMLDYVLLKPDVYWTKISKAETKPPERIPVDVEFLITMKVINVYKVLFAAPINWIENIMLRLDAVLRGFVGGKTIDQLIDLKGKASAVWVELKGNELIKNFKTEWGVEILENGIDIKEIGITEEYQKALAAQETEKMKAAGEQQRIEAIYGAIEKFGDLGKLIRTLEAAEKSSLAASLTVQAVPGLQEVLRGVFGRPPDEISTQEFRNLREMIERLSKKLEEKK
jgi:hypothetical protein